MRIPSFPPSIKRASEARWFTNWLRSEGILFHPDDPFEDYVDVNTGQPTFTPEQAKLLNGLMKETRAILGYDYPQPDEKFQLRHRNRMEKQLIDELLLDPEQFKKKVTDAFLAWEDPSEHMEGKPWKETEILITLGQAFFCTPGEPTYDPEFHKRFFALLDWIGKKKAGGKVEAPPSQPEPPAGNDEARAAEGEKLNVSIALGQALKRIQPNAVRLLGVLAFETKDGEFGGLACMSGKIATKVSHDEAASLFKSARLAWEEALKQFTDKLHGDAAAAVRRKAMEPGEGPLLA